MKKYMPHISIVSILCILCALPVSNAFAAGSVRTLGGAGTYNGTTAAATRAGTVSRAGSLRISPTKTRTVSSGTRTNSDGTTTPTERLSIGKFLNGATSISTTSASSAAAAAETANEISNINNQISEIYNTIQTIEGDITNIENTKQDSLTAGDYIKIENDEVSLDLTELEEYLTNNLDLPNKVKIEYDSATDILKWSEDGGATYTDLVDLSALTGDYVTTTELSETIATLATKSALETLTERVTTAENTITELQTAIGNIDIPEQEQADWSESDNTKKSFIKNKPTNLVTTDDLDDAFGSIVIPEQEQADWSESDNTKKSFIKNKPTNLVTTDDLDGAIDGIVIPEQAQADWTEADDSKAAFINHKPDLSVYATTEAMNEALATKADTATIGEGFDADNTVAGAIAELNTTINGDPQDENDTGLVGDVATLQNTVDSLADVAFSGSYNDLIDTPDMSGYQVKPASGVAEGKVLTYTGTDVDANVSASYVMVPVATAAPSTVAPTGFLEMWVQ